MLVKANLKALTQGECDFFNIGTGKETKTLDLYHVIYEAVREIKPGLPQAIYHLSSHAPDQETSGGVAWWSAKQRTAWGGFLKQFWARNSSDP